MELSQKIKTARENKNLTQSDLAKKIGVRSAAVISSWESGKAMPTTITVIKNLCDTLDLTLCDLFNVIPSHCNAVSSETKEIVTKMSFLDSEGKEKVLAAINAEYTRCVTPYASTPVLFQIRVQHPIFLSSDDPKFFEMKRKIATLKKKKKINSINTTSVTNFLWMIGFNGYISIAQTYALFLGSLVPSEQLYNCIASYINGTYKQYPQEFIDEITTVENSENPLDLYIQETAEILNQKISDDLHNQKHNVPFSIQTYYDSNTKNILVNLMAEKPESIDSTILPISNNVTIALIRLYISNTEISIDRFAVHHVLRCHGIGTHLLDYAKKIAIDNHIPTITVTPSGNNSNNVPNAISSENFLKYIWGDGIESQKLPKDFYEKNGFTMYKEDSRKMIYKL